MTRVMKVDSKQLVYLFRTHIIQLALPAAGHTAAAVALPAVGHIAAAVAIPVPAVIPEVGHIAAAGHIAVRAVIPAAALIAGQVAIPEVGPTVDLETQIQADR